MKPPRAVRVALVSPLPPPTGGIAKWTVLLRDKLATDPRVDLTIINNSLRARGIHQLSPFRRVVSGLIQVVLSWSRLVWVIVKDRPDVVHLNTSGQVGVLRDLALVFTSRAFGKPVLLHLRFGRIPEISDRNTLEWRIFSLVFRFTSAVIALDPATQQTLARLHPSLAVFLVPNFLNEEELPPVTDDMAEHKVTFVGWVSESKGIEDLLSAWEISETADWTLQIIGPADPAYLDSLRARFDFESVRFDGEFPAYSVLEQVASCGIFVLPSHTEGFPNVILEAMSLGRTIIATSVGAIPQMLDGGSGIVVPPQDVPKLSLALNQLIREPRERQQLAVASRARFDSEYQSGSTLATYTSIWNTLRTVPPQSAGPREALP